MAETNIEEKGIVCPLMSARDPRLANGLGKMVVHCQHEACAWWIEDKQKCAIAVLGGTKK